jgi:hypothetical protein
MNLLDIAKLNGTDKVVGLIEENRKYAPEIDVIPVRAVRGTSYYTVTRTGLPTTGFRTTGNGIAASSSTLAKKLVECYLFGGRIELDQATALASEDGVEYCQAVAASGIAMSAMQKLDFEKRVCNALIDELEKMDLAYYDQCFHHSFTNWLFKLNCFFISPYPVSKSGRPI